jgi:hypothetical protein
MRGGSEIEDSVLRFCQIPTFLLRLALKCEPHSIQTEQTSRSSVHLYAEDKENRWHSRDLTSIQHVNASKAPLPSPSIPCRTELL